MPVIALECNHLNVRALTVIGRMFAVASEEMSMNEAKLLREDIAEAMEMLTDVLQSCIENDEKIADLAVQLTEACFSAPQGRCKAPR